jgi:hypothetical protein
LVICPSFALKIAKRCQKKFFLEPFSYFRFGYFSFLCILNWPWKLSKGAFSRTLLRLFFASCFSFF